MYRVLPEYWYLWGITDDSEAIITEQEFKHMQFTIKRYNSESDITHEVIGL